MRTTVVTPYGELFQYTNSETDLSIVSLGVSRGHELLRFDATRGEGFTGYVSVHDIHVLYHMRRVMTLRVSSYDEAFGLCYEFLEYGLDAFLAKYLKPEPVL